MQWLFKVGNKKPSLDMKVRMNYWADCQLVDIRPTGTYHENISKHFVLIEDGKDYWKLRGTKEHGSSIASVLELKKWLYVVDGKGRYPWDIGYDETTKQQRVRDWYLDYKYLLDQNIITKSVFDDIYDKTKTRIIYTDRDITTYLWNEGDINKKRLPSDYTNIGGTIAQGTSYVGTNGAIVADPASYGYTDPAYATMNAFEADVAATLTGHLTAEHDNEETSLSALVTFDLVTNSYLLKLTAKSGAEHDGDGYNTFTTGAGARIAIGSGESIDFDETNDGDIADLEVSNLALSLAGYNSRGIYLTDVGGTGDVLVNRMLIQGDGSNSRSGINLQTVTNINSSVIKNNIVYGMASGYQGIYIYSYNGPTHYIYNNTLVKNGIGIDLGRTDLTIVAKNNLCQANGVDFADPANMGTTACNISEDDTSPDAAYQSKDLHTNTVFKGYATDDYRLDPDGDSTNLAILDDGEDLSGTFTDDIVGQTRSTWYIGASEIVAAGGGFQPAWARNSNVILQAGHL